MPWIDLLDRGPPKDIHTENAVLACLLLLDDARSWCRQLTTGDFYCGDNEFHGWLFSQIQTASRKFTRLKPKLAFICSKHNRKHCRVRFGIERLPYHIARCATVPYSVSELPVYVRKLKQIRIFRERLDGYIIRYQKTWIDYEDYQRQQPLNVEGPDR